MSRHRSRYEQLVAEGRIVPQEGSLADLLDREPRTAPARRAIALGILAELRADER